MNEPARLFMNLRRSLAVAVVAGAALSGCANPLAVRPVDPSSPVAAEVSKAARANEDFPSFSEVPAKPADVRPVRQYGQAAARIVQQRDALERDTAPGAWTLNGTDTFASKASRDAGPELAPGEAANPEAYAESLRRRATPPPPPRR